MKWSCGSYLRVDGIIKFLVDIQLVPPLELYRRRDDFFYKGLARMRGEIEYAGLFYMQPLPELLDVVDSPVDIVGCTIVSRRERRAILLLEDHIANYDFPYTMGKSTIVRDVVGLELIDKLLRSALDMSTRGKISAEELFFRLVQKGGIADYCRQQTDLKVLTADVTYVARSPDGQLVVMPTIGTKEDFIWDTARSAMRYLVKKQDATSTMISKIELARRLMIDNRVWAKTDRFYPIGEVIFLRPDSSLSKKAAWGDIITSNDEVLSYLWKQWLRNPLYLSDRTSYWAVDPAQHREIIGELLRRGFAEEPIVRHLHIRDPGDIEALGLAARMIKGTVYGKVRV